MTIAESAGEAPQKNDEDSTLEEGNSLSNITQGDEVEESLASILSKSIQDDENSSAPTIDPFHGILEEQEEQERAISAGNIFSYHIDSF